MKPKAIWFRAFIGLALLTALGAAEQASAQSSKFSENDRLIAGHAQCMLSEGRRI